jgi:hypothetical protein
MVPPWEAEVEFWRRLTSILFDTNPATRALAFKKLYAYVQTRRADIRLICEAILAQLESALGECPSTSPDTTPNPVQADRLYRDILLFLAQLGVFRRPPVEPATPSALLSFQLEAIMRLRPYADRLRGPFRRIFDQFWSEFLVLYPAIKFLYHLGGASPSALELRLIPVVVRYLSAILLPFDPQQAATGFREPERFRPPPSQTPPARGEQPFLSFTPSEARTLIGLAAGGWLTEIELWLTTTCIGHVKLVVDEGMRTVTPVLEKSEWEVPATLPEFRAIPPDTEPDEHPHLRFALSHGLTGGSRPEDVRDGEKIDVESVTDASEPGEAELGTAKSEIPTGWESENQPTDHPPD